MEKLFKEIRSHLEKGEFGYRPLTFSLVLAKGSGYRTCEEKNGALKAISVVLVTRLFAVLELWLKLKTLFRDHHQGADLISLRLHSPNILHSFLGRIFFARPALLLWKHLTSSLLVLRGYIRPHLVKVFELLFQRFGHVGHPPVILLF